MVQNSWVVHTLKLLLHRLTNLVHEAQSDMAKAVPVRQFLEALAHARKADILTLRAAILKSNPRVTEQIKWNAPSFCWDGEDRVTMRLQPGDRLQLIFHRGAKPKDASTFKFGDPTGMIESAAVDRVVVTVANEVKSAKALERLVMLVNLWMTSVS